MLPILKALFGWGDQAPAPPVAARRLDKHGDMVALTPRAAEIATMAAKYGWVPEQEQKNIGLLILVRGNGEQTNVYYTRMTVGTCVNHPTQGRTQLFRKNVSMAELAKILANPRVHTGKGYHQKA